MYYIIFKALISLGNSFDQFWEETSQFKKYLQPYPQNYKMAEQPPKNDNNNIYLLLFISVSLIKGL